MNLKQLLSTIQIGVLMRFFSFAAFLIAAFTLTNSYAGTHSGNINHNKPHTVKISGSPETVMIHGGKFIMGNNNGEPDEKPPHPVILDSFKIDAHEVTNAEYEQCVKAGICAPAHYDDNTCNVMTPTGWWEGIAPSVFKDQNKPVVCINWYEAKKYCEWKKGSLPTEAQWEYAARAGSKTKYIWGDDADKGCGCANGADIDGAKIFETVWDNLYPEKLNCHDGNAYTADVKSYKPNAAGLYDMTGNVWEWCSDWYGPRYETRHKPSDTNPTGPDTGYYKILRGGAAESKPDHLTATYRDRSMPHYRMIYDGFRCVYKP